MNLPNNQNNKQVKSVFLGMLRIRTVEETIAQEYEKQEIRCPVHFSIGQEAASSCMSVLLKKGDKIVSSHRSHAHYIAHGGSLKAMVGELYGKESGCCRGRGGSMHLFDLNANFVMSSPIVSSSIPIGVGIAYDFKLKKGGKICVVYLGDGATEEGVFHESANFASLMKIPVIFICENNFYSVYTPMHDRQPKRSILELAKAHNLNSAEVDGNNIFEVLKEAKHLIDLAKQSKGPGFLLCNTYRWRAHVGPKYDDELNYRPKSEVSFWKENDPIHNARQYLIQKGLYSEKDEKDFVSKVVAEVNSLIASSKKSKIPQFKKVLNSVYAK